MAIYHMSVGFVSRSTGRSSVQSAAYITGEKLQETRRDIVADYRNRQSDVIFTQTLAPDHAPAWMNDVTVWDKFESYEDTYAAKRYRSEETKEKYLSSAQTAQTYVVALPKELSPDVWKELVVDYTKERFITRNLIATVAIHNDEGNPHAHIQVSRRSITPEGEFSYAKDRLLATKSELVASRKMWADLTNSYLEREGFESRIDHRSFAELGINFEPTKHEGWFAKELESRGQQSRIVLENGDIKERNKERAGLDPDSVLNELTANKATFSLDDLARLVQKRVGDDPVLMHTVFEQAQQLAIAIGSSMDGVQRFTSKAYKDSEDQTLLYVDQLQEKQVTLSINADDINKRLSTSNSDGFTLNEEQQQAVHRLCSDTLFSVMIGRAGTGKTTTLQPVVDLHRQAGFTVVGSALAAVAAENLSVDAKCKAETIAFYLHKWESYETAQRELALLKEDTPDSDKVAHKLQATINAYKPYQLSDKHLLIVDEAGMVGTNTWEKILHYVCKANAKVIAVGDDHQFKAIEAGDIFRKITGKAEEQQQLSELSTIVRQRTEWMRTASKDLSELNTATALSSYEQRGCISALDAKTMITTIASSYIQRLSENPHQSGLLLASTNEQVAALNAAVREQLIENGQVNPLSGTIHLKGKDYSIGDKIVFLQNDRRKDVLVLNDQGQAKNNYLIKNGTCGQITGIHLVSIESDQKGEDPIETFKISVDLGKNERAEFYLKDYSNFSHGYALTLHKSQGQTVDWAMVLASKSMDAHATYVALTRHRQDVQLYYGNNDFQSFSDLQQRLGKVGHKDLVIDYTIAPEKSESWGAIQEYVLMGRELMLAAHEKQWQVFKDLKSERQELGRHILEHWQDHQSFARQAGLTHEAIAISSGLKARPLSLAEEKAQITVDQYTAVALQARDLWQQIRSTNPGVLAKQHRDYGRFEELRAERGSLANQIIEAPSLHRPFVRDLGEQLGYGFNVIQKQAEQFQHQQLQKQLRSQIHNQEQRQALGIIDQYLHARDLAAQEWKVLQPQLKQAEGTLLKPTLNDSVDHIKVLFNERDKLAYRMTQDIETFAHLARSVHVSLNIPKLFEQAENGLRSLCIDQYKNSNSILAKSMAAYELTELWQQEKQVDLKTTVRDLLQAGINLKELKRDAVQFESLQVLSTLTTSQDRQTYGLLDTYDQLNQTTKDFYKLCVEEAAEKATKPWESDYYKAFAEVSRDRDQAANDLIKQSYPALYVLSNEMGIDISKIDLEAHRHQLRQQSETFLSGMGTKSVLAAKELQAWLDFDRDRGTKQTIGIMREMQYLPQDLITYLSQEEHKALEQVKTQRSQHSSAPSQPSFVDQLKDRIQDLSKELLGEATSRTSRQWRYGRKGSIAVVVSGSQQGLYSNFESGVFGGPIKMIEDQLRVSPEKALEWAKDWVGKAPEKTILQHISPVTPAKENQWIPIMPVPEHAGIPDPSCNKYLSYMLKDREITAVYPYKSQAGQLLGYVVRLEDKDGHKITPTLTYCENEQGQQYWRWQGFGKERPLYGLDRLDKDKPILIVEGEKAADAAQKLLTKYAVLSWPGGAGAVNKADWSPLVGKDVTIWPDNDAAGLKAASQIEDKLVRLNQSQGKALVIKTVELPQDLPAKWDLADKFPETLSLDKVKDLIAPSRDQVNEPGKKLNWRELLEKTVREQKENRIQQATGLTPNEYEKVRNEFYQRLDKTNKLTTQTNVSNLSWRDNLESLRPDKEFKETIHTSTESQNRSLGEVDNALPKSPLEASANLFIKNYKEYVLADKEERTTLSQQKEFKQEIMSTSKNETLMAAIKAKNNEIGKEIETLAKSYEKEQQQNRGFDMSR